MSEDDKRDIFEDDVTQHCAYEVTSVFTETAPQERPTLFTLPPELRDMIYDLTYLPVEGVDYSEHFIGRSRFEKREKARKRAHGASYVSPPFKHLVNELMINKAFFMDAAKAFVKNRISIKGSYDVFVSHRRTGIARAYLTKAELKAYAVSGPQPPRLAVLGVKMDLPAFGECGGTKCVLQRPLTTEEIQDLASYQDLMEIRSLVKVEAVDFDIFRFNTSAEYEMRMRNLEAFERTVNAGLAARVSPTHRPPRICLGTCRPLYPRSLVCSDHPPRGEGTRTLYRLEDDRLETHRYFRPCSQLGVPCRKGHMLLNEPDELMTAEDYQRYVRTNPVALVEWVWTDGGPKTRSDRFL